MKIRNILITIILVMILSITVGFSAFVSEMSISNIVADVRIEKDVRITNLEHVGSEDIIINDINFDNDSIIGNATFNGEMTGATYKATITNFGNVDVYLGVIEPEELGLDLISVHNGLDEKIPALGGTLDVIVYIALPGPYTEDITSDFRLDFKFKRLFTVTYENLDNESATVIEGDYYSTTLDMDLSDHIEIYMGGSLIGSDAYIWEFDEFAIYSVTGDVVIKGPKTLNSVMRLNSVLDTNVSFSSSSGLATINNITYTRNGTQNDDNPIYYYRGNVTTNNVIFNNVCWKMVRTTETGGVKLIYNGVPAEDGSCNNTGTASQIGTSKFNPEYTSFAYHGYKYGNVYELLREDVPTDETIVFGTDVSYDDDTNLYVLTNTLTTSSWENDRETIGTSYRYTCLNDSGVCSEVYYISHASKISIDYIILSSGDTYVNALVKMLRNNNNSLVKNSVDNWYSENMTNVTSLLENEKWCNDRSVVSGGWSVNPTDFYLKDSYFGAYVRNYDNYAPSLECSAPNNMLYVGGGLTYPVGLLTADELTLAGTGSSGYSKSSFLYTGSIWWTMTPWKLSSNMAYNAYVNNSGSISGAAVVGNVGVRPSVVVLKNMKISSGSGSVGSPYKLKTVLNLNLSGKVYYSGNLYYEPGMTWEEWVNSEYNELELIINDDGYISDEIEQLFIYLNDYVNATDVIDNSLAYYIALMF